MIMIYHKMLFTHVLLKGTGILFQYLFLMENSILYAKIAVSNFFFKSQF